MGAVEGQRGGEELVQPSESTIPITPPSPTRHHGLPLHAGGGVGVGISSGLPPPPSTYAEHRKYPRNAAIASFAFEPRVRSTWSDLPTWRDLPLNDAYQRVSSSTDLSVHARPSRLGRVGRYDNDSPLKSSASLPTNVRLHAPHKLRTSKNVKLPANMSPTRHHHLKPLKQREAHSMPVLRTSRSPITLRTSISAGLRIMVPPHGQSNDLLEPPPPPKVSPTSPPVPGFAGLPVFNLPRQWTASEYGGDEPLPKLGFRLRLVH